MNHLDTQPMGDVKNANNSSVLFDRLIDKFNAENDSEKAKLVES